MNLSFTLVSEGTAMMMDDGRYSGPWSPLLQGPSTWRKVQLNVSSADPHLEAEDDRGTGAAAVD